MDFYICLASLLCKELRATFLCSHLGAEHIGCATALTDYCPKLWRPCLPAGGMPASNSCPLAFKMLSLLLTKTERKGASLLRFVIFVLFNDSLVWLDQNTFSWIIIFIIYLKIFGWIMDSVASQSELIPFVEFDSVYTVKIKDIIKK